MGASAPGDGIFPRADSQASIRARAVRPDLSAIADIVSRAVDGAENPRFVLDLFPGVDLEAETLSAERRASGGMTIIARLSNVEMGTAVMTIEGGVLTATVHYPGGSFLVTPQPDGSYRLAEIDQSKFPSEAAALTPSATGLLVSDAPTTAAADVPVDSGRLIDVMVVWTALAQTNAGGATAIASLAQNAVDNTNAAYLNSGIAQRLRLVYSGGVNYDETTCAAPRVTCALNYVTSDPTVANLRNTHGADLVSLLIQREASIVGPGTSTSNCGQAWLLTNAAGDAAHAFSAVSQDCAVGSLSFPHELGHNMGANDDPYVLAAGSCGDGKQPGVYCYSRGFVYLGGSGGVFGASWRTIMAYDDRCRAMYLDTCPRVPYFSNPNVSYGAATGTANYNNNALTLNNTAKVVAAYRATSALHPITPLYTDVPSGTSFFGYVQSVGQAQYASGCAAGLYCPTTYVTRRQMAAFLEREKHAANYSPAATGTVFTDVPAGAQFAGYIEALKADGITSGCTATTYCPDNPVRRDQMAKFVLKAKCGAAYVPGHRVSTFTDVPTGSAFADYIMKLSSLQITSGCTASTYCPAAYVSRDAMAKFLERALAFGYPTEACTP